MHWLESHFVVVNGFEKRESYIDFSLNVSHFPSALLFPRRITIYKRDSKKRRSRSVFTACLSLSSLALISNVHSSHNEMKRSMKWRAHEFRHVIESERHCKPFRFKKLLDCDEDERKKVVRSAKKSVTQPTNSPYEKSWIILPNPLNLFIRQSFYERLRKPKKYETLKMIFRVLVL